MHGSERGHETRGREEEAEADLAWFLDPDLCQRAAGRSLQTWESPVLSGQRLRGHNGGFSSLTQRLLDF